MKLGEIVYIVDNWEVVSCELIFNKFNNGSHNLRIRGISNLKDYGVYYEDRPSTHNTLFFSKIVAYTYLEEQLVLKLRPVRKAIREHKRTFNGTASLEEFITVNQNASDREIDLEIFPFKHDEVYPEDKLSDLENDRE
jgi:hypothetical protein